MNWRGWQIVCAAGVVVLVATAVPALVNSAPVPASRAPVAVGAHRAASPPTVPRPFSVGERLTYNVKFGVIHVGSGYMEVAPMDTVRGHDVWHTVFHTEGGTFFYHVDDVLESWFEPDSLSSLRFVQHIHEGGYIRNRTYEIYPERAVFVYNQKPEQPSVSNPLDDGSFLYFIRTLPLVVGETYTFNRYFDPKSNPVIIHVLRRERITVPAGTYNAIVVQPIIKTKGIFSKDGQAQVWFSDDSTHLMLQMKSKLSIGSIDLYLRSYQPGHGPQGSAPASGDSAGGTAAPPATPPAAAPHAVSQPAAAAPEPPSGSPAAQASALPQATP